MALTLTEKQHWKNRIETKLNARITQLRNSEPKLLEQFREAARKDVEVGLIDDFARLDELGSLKKTTRKAEDELLSEILQKITGEDSRRGASREMIDHMLYNIQRERAEEFLNDHELGKRIAGIAKRLEEFQDSILLATNIQQIIDIWDEVTALSSDQPKETESKPEPESEQDSLFAEAA